MHKGLGSDPNDMSSTRGCLCVPCSTIGKMMRMYVSAALKRGWMFRDGKAILVTLQGIRLC